MINRSGFIRGLAAIPVALAAPRAVAQSAGVANVADWFAVEPRTLQRWRLIPRDGDPMRVALRRLSSEGKPSHRIMVLYPRESPAYVTAISQILQVFRDKRIDVEFLAVNFDRDDTRGFSALGEAEATGIDLIFAMGSETTAWLDEKYRGGRLPVVSVCAKDPVLLGQMKSYERGSGTNLAFTSLNMPLDQQMAYVAKIKPQLRNIAILVDATNVSAVETQADPLAEYAERHGMRSLMLKVIDPKAARTALATLVADAVAAMRRNDPALDRSIFWITGSTAVFREIRTINAHADRVPVLSVVPEVVQAGDDSAVLSIGVSFESNAHLAAIYGADVLTGRRAVGSLPVGLVSPPDIAISFRKAREIGLRIPFRFFESAGTIYDYAGNRVRSVDLQRQG
jgi:putative ABC transport system substrate-binding protein